MQKLPIHLNQCALYKIGSKVRLAYVLGISVTELIRLADAPKYREFLLPEVICPFTAKKTKERWVQEPHGSLKRVHERIRKLLMRVKPPEYAHAAVKGRSYRTNASVHISSNMVATFDITKFYPSTAETLVFRFFISQLMCAPDVASILAKLTCCNFVKLGILQGLPTGSPLSPVLSIFANKPLFDSLDSLAAKHELKFSCYVDDLTFSGEKIPTGLTQMVKGVIEHHGHKMAEDKTRIFKSISAKHVTGVVIKDNRIIVPYSRFRKARRIEEAFIAEQDPNAKIVLAQKLAGLLGEAAFLDKKYSNWASSSYKVLADLRDANIDSKVII